MQLQNRTFYAIPVPVYRLPWSPWRSILGTKQEAQTPKILVTQPEFFWAHQQLEVHFHEKLQHHQVVEKEVDSKVKSCPHESNFHTWTWPNAFLQRAIFFFSMITLAAAMISRGDLLNFTGFIGAKPAPASFFFSMMAMAAAMSARGDLRHFTGPPLWGPMDQTLATSKLPQLDKHNNTWNKGTAYNHNQPWVDEIIK